MSGVHITEWRPGEAPTVGTAGHLDPGSVRCVELDAVVVRGRDDGLSRYAAHLGKLLDAPITSAMIENLITPDALPESTRYAGGEIRSVGMLGAHVDEGERRLCLDAVEVLGGDGWVVVCCQPTTVVPEGPDPREGARFDPRCEEFVAAIAQGWQEHRGSSAGDLGVLILHELACTFRPARQRLHAWLDEWEAAFFSHGTTERGPLVALRTMIGELRKRLFTLNADGDAHKAWFAGVTCRDLAARADKHIETAMNDMLGLSDTLRTTFDLVQMQIAQQQQELAREQQALSQRQQEEGERAARTLEFAAALFLVPTLVAGFYGANTRLPGEPATDQTAWAGFIYMLIAMAVGTAAVAFAMHRIRTRRKSRHAQV